MKDLKDPKFWAAICAILVPVSVVILSVVGHFRCWSISEVGTMIAAISGPFAGLAGFLYVYVNFLQQQAQFERQSFESGLNRLIDKYLIVSSELFPSNPKKGLHPNLKNFKQRYNSAFKFEDVLTAVSEEKISNSPRNKTPDPEIVDGIYHEIFESKFRKNHNLVQAFLPVLKFLESGTVNNKENYYILIYSQMKKDEYRVLFYGLFCNEFQMEAHEKQLLKSYFLRFDAKHLFLPNDLELLGSIPNSK